MFLILFLLFIQQEMKTDGFNAWIQTIPRINLPLEFKCDEPLEWAKIDYADSIAERLSLKGARVVGLLYQDQNKIGILCAFQADIFYPVLYEYDSVGNKIDELYFYEINECIDDAGISIRTQLRISKELLLQKRKEIIEWNYELENGEKNKTIKLSEVPLK